jgi:hypothetical protein
MVTSVAPEGLTQRALLLDDTPEFGHPAMTGSPVAVSAAVDMQVKDAM